MATPRPPKVVLSERERAELERLVRAYTTGQQVALRAHIVLLAGDGWNNLQIRNGASRLLRGIPDGTFVYFTHSYRVPLLSSTVAECEYGGGFSAVVEQDNMFGAQYHPEKSGSAGLRMLENFCRL